MNKNLSLLALSQVFGFTANIITVFLSGIVGSQITSIKSLATLPTALAVVGTAIFTILAAKIMSKIGRRLGFYFWSFSKFSDLFVRCFCYHSTKLYFILYLTFNSWFGDSFLLINIVLQQQKV